MSMTLADLVNIMSSKKKAKLVVAAARMGENYGRGLIEHSEYVTGILTLVAGDSKNEETE